MDFAMEPRMNIVLEPGASKVVTFLPLEPGALPNFARSPGAPKPLRGPELTQMIISDPGFKLFKL